MDEIRLDNLEVIDDLEGEQDANGLFRKVKRSNVADP